MRRQETLELTQSLVAQALAQAQNEFKCPLCVAVCDKFGFLLGFMCMPGAPVRSIAISQGKAYSAARMCVNTDACLEGLHRENIPAIYFCDPLLTGLAPQEDQAVTNALAATAHKA